MNTDKFIETFSNPRYTINGNIIFDAIYEGIETTFLADRDDHHEYARNVFQEAVAEKWGYITPFVETPQSQFNACYGIYTYITNVIDSQYRAYGAGFSHIAQLIIATGGKVTSDHPLSKDVDDFVTVHQTTVSKLADFVMKTTSINIRNGSLIQTLSGFKESTADQRKALLSTFVDDASKLVEELIQIASKEDLAAIKERLQKLRVT